MNVQTIINAIITALVDSPGEHTGKEIFVLVRQVLPHLSYDSFRVKLTEAVTEGKVKRTGMRGKYRFYV